MSSQRSLRRFCQDANGASATEFALIAPLFVLMIFAIIDAGWYGWSLNRAEKATQMGVRMAVVTDPVAEGLTTENYVGKTIGGVTLTQGDAIPAAALSKTVCTNTGTTCSCTGTCLTDNTKDSAAFNRIVTRMRAFDSSITADQVEVEYAGSGLGFAGDPSGMEIAPLTTVRLKQHTFKPLTGYIFGASVPMPSFSATLTMEDGLGVLSN